MQRQLAQIIISLEILYYFTYFRTYSGIMLHYPPYAVLSCIVWLCGVGLCDDIKYTIDSTTMFTRHGDRKPVYTLLEERETDVWPKGKPHLTVKGAFDHMFLGVKLRRRYIEELKLVSRTYKPEEVSVRSTDVPRVIASAKWNFHTFYGNEIEELPETLPKWPTVLAETWFPNQPAASPIEPVRVPLDDDYELRIDVKCPRRDALQNLVRAQPEYQKFRQHVQNFLENELEENCGEKVPFEKMFRYDDLFRVKKIYGQPVSKWATDELQAKIHKFDVEINRFDNGGGFDEIQGVNVTHELKRIRAGPTLWRVFRDIFDRIECNRYARRRPTDAADRALIEKCAKFSKLKYIFISVHDLNLRSLALGFNICVSDGVDVDGLSPTVNPPYGTALSIELWKRKRHGSRFGFKSNFEEYEDPDYHYYLKFLLWRPSKRPESSNVYENITRYVDGCRGSDSSLCPLGNVYERASRFFPASNITNLHDSVKNLCFDVDSIPTPKLVSIEPTAGPIAGPSTQMAVSTVPHQPSRPSRTNSTRASRSQMQSVHQNPSLGNSTRSLFTEDDKPTGRNGRRPTDKIAGPQPTRRGSSSHNKKTQN